MKIQCLRDTTCTIEGCAKPYRANGLCGMHYERVRRHGTTMSLHHKICTMEDCEKPHKSHGYCSMHVGRFLKYGDPLKVTRQYGIGDTPEQRFWSKVAVTANNEKCWEWLGARHSNHYGTTTYIGRANRLTHRLAWFLTHHILPDDKVVMHKCDNPPCCNPKHLFLGTQKENMEDMVAKNRISRLHHSLCTEDQVRRVRILFAQGYSRQEIMAIENLTYRPVRDIDTGRSFGWIE